MLLLTSLTEVADVASGTVTCVVNTGPIDLLTDAVIVTWVQQTLVNSDFIRNYYYIFGKVK